MSSTYYSLPRITKIKAVENTKLIYRNLLIHCMKKSFRVMRDTSLRFPRRIFHRYANISKKN